MISGLFLCPPPIQRSIDGNEKAHTYASLAIYTIDDARFFDALVRMFQQALKYVQDLPATQQPDFIARLDRVRQQGKSVGWSVGEDFNHYWSVAFGVANDRFSSR